MLRTVPLFLMVTLSQASADIPPIRGEVVDAVTGAPIAGATVYGESDTQTATTDESGRFELAGGASAITVVDGDHAPVVIDVLSGELTVRLQPLRTTNESGEVIEVIDERRVATPGGVRIDRAQLGVIPGARGDVLSGVKNLPGIANNGSLTPLSSGLIIRGSSPEDSRILVDGFEIPVLYHFLGVQSVIPTEMLEGLDYQPGTFGVEYGRASGGIVAATSREASTSTGGFAELSFVNVGGLVQGTIGPRASYAVAARRSVIDAILPAVLPEDSGLSFTAYPRYYDYQAKISYRPTARWTLSGFVFGSDDQVRLLSDADNATDPVASGEFSNHTSFTRAISSARYKRPGLEITNAVSVFTDTNHFEVGSDRHLRLDRSGIASRHLATWDVSSSLRVVGGAEADITHTDYDIKFTRPPREGDPRGPNFTQDALIETTGDNTFTDLATWASAVVYPVPTVELTAGLRVDDYVRNNEVVVQPRGQVVWNVTDGSTLRAAGGLYTRPPENLDEGLQTDLDPERALQVSVGGEQRLSSAVTVQATVFATRFTDLIVLPDDRRDPSSLAGYENMGTGEARGVELLLKLRTESIFGWLAYTGSHATRRDNPDMPDRLFDYDQMHNLIAVASVQLSPRWRIGGRFQLTSGKPYTPVVGAMYQSDVDLYLPQYGVPASQRTEVQHQLDLRIDRQWTFSQWKLSAYLDVTNAYLNAAAIDYQYNFDYTRRTALTTLPIIPSFGLRGEL